MKNMNKLAVAVFAVLGLSGCASTHVAGPAAADAVTVREVQVLRPTQNYGSLGGYRYRRFAVTTL
jgi:outer membrane lipoprotein SlyB